LEDWPAGVVSDIVQHYQECWSIDTIVTFDGLGVSGHPNHKHTHRGVVHHHTSNNTQIEYYHLDTAPLLVKYSAWLAIFYYAANNNRAKTQMFINKDHALVWDAMRAHYSQLVWFRRIYLWFSSYVYVNQVIKQ
jgi:N-acetylglucosaminylphosphatidylinositol deacetylase